MDIGGAFSTVIDELANRIRTLKEEKPVVLALSVGLILLAFIALIIVLIQTRPQKQPPEPTVQPFTADAPLFIPDAPSLTQDYYPSRIPGKTWSSEDIEKWFTTPDEETMRSLENANDKIISDILGAAP